MERRGASPSAVAESFGIPHWRIRKAIREGALTPHAIGCKSVLLFVDVEKWIRSHPPIVKSGRPKAKCLFSGVDHGNT